MTGVEYKREPDGGLWCTIGGIRCRPDPDVGCTISYCEDGEREQTEATPVWVLFDPRTGWPLSARGYTTRSGAERAKARRVAKSSQWERLEVREQNA